jgi:hypothetical protein
MVEKMKSTENSTAPTADAWATVGAKLQSEQTAPNGAGRQQLE